MLSLLTGYLININIVIMGPKAPWRGLELCMGLGVGGEGCVCCSEMVRAEGWLEFLAPKLRLPSGRWRGWMWFSFRCTIFL